jgi:hypothetical protein
MLASNITVVDCRRCGICDDMLYYNPISMWARDNNLDYHQVKYKFLLGFSKEEILNEKHININDPNGNLKEK